MIAYLNIIKYSVRGIKKLKSKIIQQMPQDLMPQGFTRQNMKSKLNQLQKEAKQKKAKQKKKAQLNPSSQFNQELKKQNTAYPNKPSKQIDQANQRKVMQMLKQGKRQQQIKNAIQLKSQLQKMKQDILARQNIDSQAQFIQANQDMILTEIKKNSSKKQINLNELTTSEQFKINKHKADKLLSNIQQYRNKVQQIDLTQQDIIRAKYTPQIIEKAKNWKNKDLFYFKNLIGDSTEKFSEQGFQRPFKDEQLNEARTHDKKFQKQFKKNQEKYFVQRKQEAKKLRKKQQSIIRYQDNEMTRERGIKQFVQMQNITENDNKILQQGQRDLKQAYKMNDIFLQQYDKDDQIVQKYYKSDKRQIYDQSSFGKQKAKLIKFKNDMMKKGVDMDLDQLYNVDRQILIFQKNFRQDQEQFQKGVAKRQQRKLMKKQLKLIHQKGLRDDLNYDQPTDPGFKFKKNQQLIQDIKNPDKQMQQAQKFLNKQASVLTVKDKHWKIHREKTLKKMQIIINKYFFNLQNSYQQQSLHSIQITAIQPNQALTVLNVFWNFKQKQLKFSDNRQVKRDDEKQTNQKASLNISQENLQKVPQIQKFMQKKGTYLGGKMTQIMGLRYAPDIRFYFDQMLEKSQSLLLQIKKHKQEVVESELQDYKKKGLVKTQQDQKIYRKKLQVIADQNLRNFNSRQTILSKGYRKIIKQKYQMKNYKTQNVQIPKKKTESTLKHMKDKNKKQRQSLKKDNQDQISLQQYIQNQKNKKNQRKDQKFWQVIDKY